MQRQRDAVFHLNLGAFGKIDNVPILPLDGVALCVTADGNLKADHTIFTKDEVHGQLESEGTNVANSKWHHIAYSRYNDVYSIFIDGEVVETHFAPLYATHREFTGDVAIIWMGTSEADIKGNIVVDDVGFFEVGFSPYEIKALYEVGLSKFLEVVPVDSKGKTTITWGEIKKYQ